MRTASLTALVGFVVLALVQPASALVWTIETVDHPSNANVGDGSSIALDSAGRPHIAYRDSIHNLVKYARKKADGTWTIETVEIAGFVSSSVSLALDSAGVPHIVYYSGPGITNPAHLRHASRSCFVIWCSWDKETVRAGVFSPSSAGNTSATFDSQGILNVSYFDHTAGQLKWAKKTGGAWSIANVVATAGGAASLALDADNFPHLAVSDSRAGSVSYARVICVFILLCGWNLSPVDTDTAGTLRLDLSGQPHLSYAQRTTIRYASGTCPGNDPCTWALETVGVANADIQRPPTLALDPCSAHIAFLRQRGPGVADLVYAKRVGTTWNVEVADLDASSTVIISLTLDNRYLPHISYQGTTGPGRALKYATAGFQSSAARRRPLETPPTPAPGLVSPSSAPRTLLERPMLAADCGLSQ
jgi:hypothetical protein